MQAVSGRLLQLYNYSKQTCIPCGLLQVYNYPRRTATPGRLLQFYSYSRQTAIPGRLPHFDNFSRLTAIPGRGFPGLFLLCHSFLAYFCRLSGPWRMRFRFSNRISVVLCSSVPCVCSVRFFPFVFSVHLCFSSFRFSVRLFRSSVPLLFSALAFCSCVPFVFARSRFRQTTLDERVATHFDEHIAADELRRINFDEQMCLTNANKCA